MAQKKKNHLRLLPPPEDLKGIAKKVWRFRLARIRKTAVVIVLLILAVCGTYLLLNNQTYSKVRTAAEYENNISDTSSYEQFADGIVRYNRDGVAFLNKKNEEQWIQSTQLKNPVMIKKDKAFAVADNGGNTILVFSREGLKGEIQTTLPIEKVAVSDQGIVSAVLREGSTPKIITYDATGNVLVELQISPSTTGYPNAMELSDDGKTLAVSYLIVTGTGIRSKVVFYDFGEEGKDKPDNIISSQEFNGTIMAELFFMGDSRFVAVGDNKIVFYKKGDAYEADREIDMDQEIQSVFHTDSYIGLVLLNEKKSGYEIRLLNRNGDRFMNRALPGKYSHVKADGNEVLMYDGDRCCIITETGIIKYQGELESEVQEIFKATGINRYYVMNADKLQVVYLSK